MVPSCHLFSTSPIIPCQKPHPLPLGHLPTTLHPGSSSCNRTLLDTDPGGARGRTVNASVTVTLAVNQMACNSGSTVVPWPSHPGAYMCTLVYTVHVHTYSFRGQFLKTLTNTKDEWKRLEFKLQNNVNVQWNPATTPIVVHGQNWHCSEIGTVVGF